MFSHAPLSIKNLKGHFKLKEIVKKKTFFNILSENEKISQLFTKVNFSIFRDSHHRKIAFTIFHNSPHVNITGISTWKELGAALSRFNKQLQQDIKIENVIIDNITAVGSIWKKEQKSINLIQIEEKVLTLNLPNTTVSLRPEFFPGAVIRVVGSGTVILFSSGKYIIVGVKTLWELEATQKNFLVIIQQTE